MKGSLFEALCLEDGRKLGGEILAGLAVLGALVEHQEDGESLEFLCQGAAEAGAAQNNVLLLILFLEIFDGKSVAGFFELF